MALPSGYVEVFEDTFTESTDTALASHTPDTDPTGAGWTERHALTVKESGDYVDGGNSSDNEGELASLDMTGDFLIVGEFESTGASIGDATYCGPLAFISGGVVGFNQRTQTPGNWRMYYNGPNESFTTGTTDNFPSGVPSGYQELALERVGDVFKSYVNGDLMQSWDLSGTTDFSGAPTMTPGFAVGTFATGVFPRCTRLRVMLPAALFVRSAQQQHLRRNGIYRT